MTEGNQRYRSDVAAAMADEQASDDVNKIQQQEGEDGEIDDEIDDEATNATGMGARPKTTVTSAPTKTAKTAKQSSRRGNARPTASGDKVDSASKARSSGRRSSTTDDDRGRRSSHQDKRSVTNSC